MVRPLRVCPPPLKLPLKDDDELPMGAKPAPPFQALVALALISFAKV